MEENTALEILKGAVLLEIRGKSFYQKVANDSESEAVRDFFEQMAGEEEKHIKILAHQYRSYQNNQKFDPEAFSEEKHSGAAQEVLTDKIKQQISAAGFESAAIAAAMAMERDAIQYYSKREKDSRDPDEKALYRWLASWETRHLDMLVDIDKAMIREIWNDNQFWPF
ncbi:MAG: ferritin family protein [Desulfobacterales bacterium]